jgi:hypothetical protein
MADPKARISVAFTFVELDVINALPFFTSHPRQHARRAQKMEI